MSPVRVLASYCWNVLFLKGSPGLTWVCGGSNVLDFPRSC